MTAKLIDGRKIALQVRDSLKTRADVLKNKGVTAGLATVIVGENQASQLYVRLKTKAAKEVGLSVFDHILPPETTEEGLLDLIEQLNSDEQIHGILVQLPLPKHINKQNIMGAINPQKDVDGFHPTNVGRILLGDESLASATAKGVVKLIEGVSKLKGKEVVVVGHSTIVGKPLALMLLMRDATVTVCHEFTKDLASHTSKADILVSATGVAKLIKCGMVKEGVVVVDVGVSKTEDGLCGDVDYDTVKDKASYITPVPGGVGPMTIAMLVENTLNAAEFNPLL